MTMWLIVLLVVVALEINDRRRLRKQKEYVDKVAELMKKLEAREIADEYKRLALEAAELEKARKLFVCFSGDNKDRIEMLQLTTQAPSPEQAVCDAVNLYFCIIEERKNGRILCSFDESSRTLRYIRTEPLDNVKRKVEG